MSVMPDSRKRSFPAPALRRDTFFAIMQIVSIHPRSGFHVK
jgi:hypothetical protein